jgi:hypothetical protein
VNLAVCLSRSGRFEAAVERAGECLKLRPDNVVAIDTLAHSLSKLGRYEEAAAAGTRSLVLKDRRAGQPPSDWSLPAMSPAAWAGVAAKRNIISFSLWGSSPRYLRGAVDNVLAARRLYPGWTCVFFADESVPAAVRRTLIELGAQVRLEPGEQPIRYRLGWRFKVANEVGVGRFLVRDADSVVSERERDAVAAWLQSDCWFHAMRDWWTHSDLLLAGMWGGVAGVLPDLHRMLGGYQSAAMETPNIDQWFLRDRVWRYVRQTCLVHDRCFTPPGAVPWPGSGACATLHVGQDEFSVRGEEQERRVAAFMRLA